MLDTSDSDEIESLLNKQIAESQQDINFEDDEQNCEYPTNLSDLTLQNNFARAFEMIQFFTTPQTE